MPIIEPVRDTSAPLSQGDILKGVSLFLTQKPWESDGGASKKTDHTLCLVLSRPCVGEHKDRLIISAVEKYKNTPPEFEDFNEVQEFYKQIRDGHAKLDLFYLGQVPEFTGSFCARLDSLHTIRVPADGPDKAALLARRIGTLHIDFARDLHVRIFRAFASLGFDDHQWFPVEDLRTVVMLAERDEARINADLLAVQVKLQAGTSQAFSHDSERKKLETSEADLRKKLEKIQKEAKPYCDELAKRMGQ